MSSLSLMEVLRQARGMVADAEDALYGDLTPYFADVMTGALEALCASEFEHRIGVRVYERGAQRRGHRNGHRRRQVQTPVGTLTLEVPRLREEGFVPAFLKRGERAIEETQRWVARALLCGISRAEIVRFAQSVTGCRPSEGLLRQVQQELDKAVRSFRQRPLEGRYQYLFLDAAWVKDIVGTQARRICILCGVGVTADGKREILGFAREPRECTAGWSRFLGNLLQRGLNAEDLVLVISDEHEGIKGAVQEKLGDVRHQYCWAHRCRNIYEALAKADRAEMVEHLRRIYRAPHQTAACTAVRDLSERWRATYPSIVAEMEKDAGNLLAFLHCEPLHREYVRTSNPIERVFVELRRSRFGCGAFANRESCDRVVGNVLMRLNGHWAEEDIWMVRRRRHQRRQAATADDSRPAHLADPVSGARVAPQQSPILPDGWSMVSASPTG